ncbi:hypothetical protein [Fimbriiglobus ruber]|uniref:Uncharacterized protein n=1 Tax=Fimbriiglobus ruber TaxID=1908690 RepID=A0A225DCZ1_9BACT|nr:hypothetical protein [Fimbriiglobus ruber]OWK36408.1 hypothetical protein FRUB_08971 [Fimbriiglobus ruber]
MGTLGKVLLFINLLAAAGVAYLATQDWAKRQEISAVATDYLLILVGMPVQAPTGADDDKDSVPLNMTGSGGVPIESVSTKFLENHFKGTNGGTQLGDPKPPRTQLDEVKRVGTKLESQLNDAGDAQKIQVLCGSFNQNVFTPGWLILLAERYDERDFVRKMVSADQTKLKENAETAVAMFKKKFATVQATPNPRLADEEATRLKTAGEEITRAAEAVRGANTKLVQAEDAFRGKTVEERDADEGYKAARKVLDDALTAADSARQKLKAEFTNLGSTACRDDADRRLRIAHLLVHLDYSAEWQKRVALVTGLRVYSAAISDQVNHLREMAASVNQQIVSDQARFSEEYELLKGLAVQNSLLLDQQLALKAEYEAQRARDSEAAKQRAAQLVERQQDLAAIRAQVAASLEKQAQVEKDLLDTERTVGNTLQKNFDLEQQLLNSEQKTRATNTPVKDK